MRPVPSAPAVPPSSSPLVRLACLLALSAMPVLLQAAPAALEREVNTFIGSKDDGNTFPGASAPFG
ncbi:MAG: alpha-1 2-mannosidase, partial [Stenotrophomonas sp.]